MNKTLPAFILLLTSYMQTQAQTAKTLKNADFIIRHVNVITMADSNPKINQCVCIDDDKISFIGDDNLDAELKGKAIVIEGTGKYLMPGMAEMHAHLPPQPELKNYFTLNLMAGVTTVRSMRGKTEHLTYRTELNYPIPSLYLAAPPVPWSVEMNDAYADSLVRSCKKAGYDFLKVLAIKDSVSFAALTKAANKHGLPVCGHLPGNMSLEFVLNSGYNDIEHMGGQVTARKKGDDYFRSILELTKKNNVYHCPTLDWYQMYYQQLPETEMQKRFGMNYIHDSVKQKWSNEIAEDIKKMGDSAYNVFKSDYKKIQEQKLEALKIMSDNNIGLLTGEDGGDRYLVPGFNMIEEMKLFSRAGIGNYKILQYATISAARYMKQDNNWGTVEKGKDANLVLLSANPLDDLNAVAQVEGIFLDKKFLSQKELAASLN